MLALGRALMSEPKLLMLDEPSLGLAPAVVEKLYDTLQQLHEEGLTLLLAEQSIPLALGIADYAYVLQTGRIGHRRQGGGAGEQRAGAGNLSRHQYAGRTAELNFCSWSCWSRRFTTNARVGTRS